MSLLRISSLLPKVVQMRQLYATNQLLDMNSTRGISTEDDNIPIDMENPFQREKQECILCKMNLEPDYKNVKLLSQFVSPFTGRVYGRHITGLCKNKQERLVNEIQKAQNAAFMPYYNKEPEFLEDPKLFNPERPIRPHSY